MYIIYLHINLSVILHTTEAVMALHSIYKPLAPKNNISTTTTVILLNKLQYYGIDGISLSLIRSCLTDRFQYVQFENSESDLLEIKAGIPQGSILGPLFFSIMINDLVNSSNKFKFLMYADDTTIYFNLEDFPIENREVLINNELEKVNKWLKLNKLAVNVDKTKSMLFHKRRPVTPIQFSMNNRIIDVVQYFNYLGIMLDADMSWKTHVAMVRNKFRVLMVYCTD